MKIKFLGHASFQIELGGKSIIIDPFITGAPYESEIDVTKLEADFILLTHAHGDHIADAEQIAKNNDALIISNFEICNYFDEKGCNVHPLNHGGKVKFGDIHFKYVNAIHTSSFPNGNYGGQPGGFVIWDQDKCVYHAGDTALTMDMKLIPSICPALDLAILPIGDNFTMGYEDAALAADFIKCKHIIGCHFDTFDYIKIDRHEAKHHFAEQGNILELMEIGESRIF